LTYDGTETSQQEFEDFMGSNACISIMVPSLPVTKIMSAVHTEFATFQKAMKRDAGLYPVITQDAQWDTWNCSLVSIARAQAIDHVLDSTYVPSLPDEIASFAEKQKYMFSVFELALQTDRGKAIIRSHEATYDARTVYKEMNDYYCNRDSMSLLDSRTLPSYITSVPLGDGSCSASAQYDIQFGTAPSATLAQASQVYASLHDETEACQHLTFDPGDYTMDVMIDDPGHVVAPAEHPNDDLPEPDLLACSTDRTDNDTIPPEVLVQMTSNAISCHTNNKQGMQDRRLAGKTRVHHKHANGRTMDIEAIVQQRMCRTPFRTAGAVDKTVHSVGQIEAFQHGVYDEHTRVGGQQSIPIVTSEADWYPTTLDKDEWDSLPYVNLTSAADWYPTTLDKDEWDNLHHFSLTSADERDPSPLDREWDDDDDALTDETVHDSIVHVPIPKVDSTYDNAGHRAQAIAVDYVFQCPTLGWFSADIIRATFQYTTQYVHPPGSEILKRHYKSPFHALTVFRIDAPVERLGLVDGTSSSMLRLAPIDGEFLRQFVQFKEILPRQTSPTDNIVDLYRSSPSSPPPKTILDPADLIGWLFLKDQDNGERSASSSSPPKPMIVRPIKDPTDLIGWLFLKDKDNGERLSHLLEREYPKPATVSPISDPAGERHRVQMLPNGERPSSSPTIKPVAVRSTIDTTDLVGWLFLKDQDNGERHRVKMLSHLGCGRTITIIDPTDRPD
jgi:hypothetical protein